MKATRDLLSIILWYFLVPIIIIVLLSIAGLKVKAAIKWADILLIIGALVLLLIIKFWPTKNDKK